MLTDNPNLSSSQLHHHITDEAKEIKGHGSPLYLSHWHRLVYRKGIIQVFLWSKWFFFCFNTLNVMKVGNKPEKHWNWLWLIAVCSTHLCLIPLHLCFLNFLPKYQTPAWGCKTSLASRESWDFFQPALGFWMFSQLSASWHCCKIIFLLHISVSPWSLLKHQNIQS